MNRKLKKKLKLFRINLVRDVEIIRFQEKENKSQKKKISAKNPGKFRVDTNIIGD